jgi:WD40 repeat protein
LPFLNYVPNKNCDRKINHINLMSNLIVPIFLWNSPPSHEITSALLSTNKTSLFTGSQKGQICIWGLDLKDRVSFILYLHESNYSSVIIGFSVGTFAIMAKSCSFYKRRLSHYSFGHSAI